ncbi:hypothetical protein [Sorangium sp. So ce861]|uniref:hypothetical protein n=1 Tax=Sorangium sp. So ce861 TaxID=3133323 RepID=UPI003F6413A2
MKRSKLFPSLAGCVLAATSLTGCSSRGSLTVALTINDSHDTRECFNHRVSGLVVSVEDEAGSVVTAHGYCEDRSLTIDDLSEGQYDVEVWLEVFDGQATSKIVRVKDVDVLDGRDTLVEVNFRSMEIDP